MNLRDEKMTLPDTRYNLPVTEAVSTQQYITQPSVLEIVNCQVSSRIHSFDSQ